MSNNLPIIQQLYFSPTHSTKKILNTIAESTGYPQAPKIDLTHLGTREAWNGELEGDIILLGTPIYSQAFPYLYLQKLRESNWEGKKIVVIGVYGHVKVNDLLEQAHGLVKEKKGQLLTAAYFLAEHTFTTPDSPIRLAEHRPDEDDLNLARTFGIVIKKCMDGEIDDAKGLLRDYFQETANKYVHEKKQLKANKPAEKPPSFPPAIKPSRKYPALCTACNKCVLGCPVSCIDPTSYEPDYFKCIQCMACVKGCPENVWKIDLKMPMEKLEFFQSFEHPRKTPEFWL